MIDPYEKNKEYSDTETSLPLHEQPSAWHARAIAWSSHAWADARGRLATCMEQLLRGSLSRLRFPLVGV